MQKVILYLALVFGATLSMHLPAQAYSLDDHEWMTEKAIQRANSCIEKLDIWDPLITPLYAEILTKATLHEDLNLFQKWTDSSHYFNPEKRIDLWWRTSSDERVIQLEAKIQERLRVYHSNKPFPSRAQGNLEDIFDFLGHAIHHIQDMASPPHVIPITHGLGDGYESFELYEWEKPFQTAPRIEECLALSDSLWQSLEHLHLEVAKDTMRAVRGYLPIAITVNQTRTVLRPWRYFWEESSDTSFGDYGVLGNHFGETQVMRLGGVHYQVERKTFVAMKRDRMKKAVNASVRAILALHHRASH